MEALMYGADTLRWYGVTDWQKHVGEVKVVKREKKAVGKTKLAKRERW